MYFTYVLQSAKDDGFYIGFTKDLKLRFEQHSKGLRKNNFTFSHPIFRPSLPAPQSQSPRNSNTIPVALLNPSSQI
jgi:hypothetical protein